MSKPPHISHISRRRKKPKEIWKNITHLGHDWYAVSQLGRIRINNCHRTYSNGRRRFVKQRRQPISVYSSQVHVDLLHLNGKSKTYLVKKIVAMYWLDPYDPSKTVRFKNRTKIDCRAINLYQKGIDKEHANSILTKNQVIKIKKEYKEDPVAGKYQKLADKYGVSRRSIVSYVNGTRRASVDPNRDLNKYIQIQDTKEKRVIPMAKPSLWDDSITMEDIEDD